MSKAIIWSDKQKRLFLDIYKSLLKVSKKYDKTIPREKIVILSAVGSSSSLFEATRFTARLFLLKDIKPQDVRLHHKVLIVDKLL